MSHDCPFDALNYLGDCRVDTSQPMVPVEQYQRLSQAAHYLGRKLRLLEEQHAQTQWRLEHMLHLLDHIIDSENLFLQRLEEGLNLKGSGNRKELILNALKEAGLDVKTEMVRTNIDTPSVVHVADVSDFHPHEDENEVPPTVEEEGEAEE